MKRFKLFIIVAFMAVIMAGCSGKTNEVEADPQEEVVQDNTDSLVRICKLSACKIGYQSGEIISLYASGEMSLNAASKLLKTNYEDIKYLYDLKIYSEEDDKYMFALYGNVMSAFNELYEEGDGYIDNVELISKCVEKLMAE